MRVGRKPHRAQRRSHNHSYLVGVGLALTALSVGRLRRAVLHGFSTSETSPAFCKSILLRIPFEYTTASPYFLRGHPACARRASTMGFPQKSCTDAELVRHLRGFLFFGSYSQICLPTKSTLHHSSHAPPHFPVCPSISSMISLVAHTLPFMYALGPRGEPKSRHGECPCRAKPSQLGRKLSN